MGDRPARWRNGLIAVFSAVALTGCVANPYIDRTGVPDPFTYQNVKKETRGTITAFNEKLRDTEQFDFWSGIAGLATAVTGTAFGTLGGSQDSIIIAALSGGTVLGLRAFVPTAERKQIYIRGGSALECAIAATSFSAGDGEGGGGATGEERLRASLADLAATPDLATAGLAAVQVQLRSALASPEATPNQAALAALASLQVTQLSSAVSESDRRTADFVGAVNDFVEQRAARLDSARIAVIQEVNRQLAEAGLDPDAAMSAAAQSVQSPSEETRETGKAAIDATRGAQEKAAATEALGEQLSTVAAADAGFAATAQGATTRAIRIRELLDERVEDTKDVLDALTDAGSCFRGFVNPQ